MPRSAGLGGDGGGGEEIDGLIVLRRLMADVDQRRWSDL
jgi:hypothetical protein